MDEYELAHLTDQLLHALEPIFKVFDVTVVAWSVNPKTIQLKSNDEKDRASMWEEDRGICAPVQVVETNLLEYLCLFL